MMKKHIFFFTIAFAASFGLISCIENDVKAASEQGYRVDIPVQAVSTKTVTDDGTNAVATYKTTENVYVYNETSKTIDDGVLHPTANASETTFSGTLNKTYAVGNTLKVLYNTNSQGVVDYSEQDGYIGSVKDAGVGEVTISSVSDGVITTSSATLNNLQSIFRFTFRDKKTSTELKVRFVRIFSRGGYLQASYDAVKNTAVYGPVTISRDSYSNYVYAGLRLDKQNDQLVFQVITSDGKVYSGSKNAPSGGFDIGKFYKATVDVDLYTFTVSSGKKVCFSPGDLGVDNGVYSFTEPFTTWGWKTSDVNATKRVWFDYREIDSDDDPATAVYGLRWRNFNSLTTSTETTQPQEWDKIIGRTNMNDGVQAYYRVSVSGHANCLLLPPDETQSSDIGTDLTSGTVTDYVKYLGKGFVLLISTGRAQGQTSFSWGYSSEGWYWALWKNMTQNRTYFNWTSSNTPIVTWTMAEFRMRVRLIRDIE